MLAIRRHSVHAVAGWLFPKLMLNLFIRKVGKVFPYSLPSVGPGLIPVYRQSARR